MIRRRPSRAMAPPGAALGAALVALLLGGCVSSAEMARINAENDIERCAGYGFKPGTDAFAGCRLELDRRRDEERAALMAAPFPGPVYVAPPGPCWSTPWGLRCEPW